MRIYLEITLAILSIGTAIGLECKMGLSEAHCGQLHERYQELKEEFERVGDRIHINPSAYQTMHRELVRIAAVTNLPIPGSIKGKALEYGTLYSSAGLEDQKDLAKEGGYSSDLGKVSEQGGAEESQAKYENKLKAKKCHDSVSQERCDELLRQYDVMTELYGNETTKKMLNMDAYNDLHRDLTEAGISVAEKGSEYAEKDMSCHSSVEKAACDALTKKYTLMKKMYADPELKDMLNPAAYSDLHRDMEEAGMKVTGSMHKDTYAEKTCDSSVPKEECEALLKKYKLMKEMYNDADLKKMLNPDAYSELHREMEEAGITEKSKSKEDDDTKKVCDSSVPEEECEALLKKYKLMKEMYNDADLKKMLNPDAYSELHREMVEAGLETDEKTQEDTYAEKTCDSSVPKEECEALLKKYKLMKEMYNDADLKKMLNPDAYSELHREMVEAGLETDEKTHDDTYAEKTCDSSVPKEECEALLKKYKLMKEMYNNADLKKMLNPDAYNELQREMVAAGLETDEKKQEDTGVEKTCDSSIPKEECEALLKKYKLMKEMYNDADLKKMLNPDAYSELRREMVEAGLETDEKKQEDTYAERTCDSSVPKEECEALLKKYKLMKEMYNDADLKKLLNPDAYSELHRDMEEAGIKTESKPREMSCKTSQPSVDTAESDI